MPHRRAKVALLGLVTTAAVVSATAFADATPTSGTNPAAQTPGAAGFASSDGVSPTRMKKSPAPVPGALRASEIVPSL